MGRRFSLSFFRESLSEIHFSFSRNICDKKRNFRENFPKTFRENFNIKKTTA
jgi:hypothetical protein